MNFGINVWEKDGEYIASCPELEIFCYGENEEQAKLRLKKVIQFYIETATDLGYRIEEGQPIPVLTKMTSEEKKQKKSNIVFS